MRVINIPNLTHLKTQNPRYHPKRVQNHRYELIIDKENVDPYFHGKFHTRSKNYPIQNSPSPNSVLQIPSTSVFVASMIHPKYLHGDGESRRKRRAERARRFRFVASPGPRESINHRYPVPAVPFKTKSSAIISRFYPWPGVRGVEATARIRRELARQRPLPPNDVSDTP